MKMDNLRKSTLQEDIVTIYDEDNVMQVQ